MRQRSERERRCTVVVPIEREEADPDGLQDLAGHLSELSACGCEVVVLDASPRAVFDEHARRLRWVSRHIAVHPSELAPAGLTRLRTALLSARCEKVILATEFTRYGPAEIDRICALLDDHEVVEPEEYVQPLPWWGMLEAGRLLVMRGLDTIGGRSETFGMRRSAVGGLKRLDPHNDDPEVRQLGQRGAEVYSTADVFIRRQPPELGRWLRSLPGGAGKDLALPLRSVLFLALIPLAILLALTAGLQALGVCAALLMAATVLLALKGRAGAAPFFPLRASLMAPVTVLERSISVYWALFSRLRRADGAPRHAPTVASGTSRRTLAG